MSEIKKECGRLIDRASILCLTLLWFPVRDCHGSKMGLNFSAADLNNTCLAGEAGSPLGADKRR